MLRRKFLGSIATLSAGSIASLAAIKAAGASDSKAAPAHTGDRHVITYAVQGFTCVTCAVGLEVLLKQQTGVLTVHADYPAAAARVEYDPAVVTDQKLRSFIEETGFRVSGIIA